MDWCFSLDCNNANDACSKFYDILHRLFQLLLLYKNSSNSKLLVINNIKKNRVQKHYLIFSNLIVINGVKIPEVLSLKDLGVMFDNKLASNLHIAGIVSKSDKLFGLFYKNC